MIFWGFSTILQLLVSIFEQLISIFEQESYLRTLDNWKRKTAPVRSIMRKTAGLLGTEWSRFLGCRKKKNDS